MLFSVCIIIILLLNIILNITINVLISGWVFSFWVITFSIINNVQNVLCIDIYRLKIKHIWYSKRDKRKHFPTFFKKIFCVKLEKEQ